ncbi:hypothetical protein R5R35_005623 [Gryllus longicercus]|uniref:allantoinase n=1 Tax=Gryllus longicercus TaxID=2509291 RepID=A0AAN9Z2S2_9ORTH
MATLFRSRRVVLPGGVREAGLLVGGDGRVARVLEAHELLDPAHAAGPHLQVEDLGELVLMPGVVDSHVHVNEPGRTAWEGFSTATRAAAAGGITTIVDMPLNSIPPTTTKANLEIKLEAAKGKVHVDVAFWGGVVSGNQRHLKDMVEAGVVGFKCFLCPTGVQEFSSASVADVEEALKELQGTKSVLAFHAEVDLPDVEPPQKDKARKYQTYLNTRPPLMEVTAIRKVAELCQQYKVRCHIVHLSAAEALPIVRNAKARGNQLTAETCHHYLSLASENIPDGATQFKCCPPIRNQKNQEHLWTALRSNVLDMVVSDHSPATADTKRLEDGNFLEAWGGIASVQFGLSLFWTAASERKFTLTDVAKFLCHKPAKLCSLERRKGHIAEGMDADFVIWDPEASFVVDPSAIHFKNKITPYLNKTLKGRVIRTIVRGKTVYEVGKDFPAPQGHLILLSNDMQSN